MTRGDKGKHGKLFSLYFLSLLSKIVCALCGEDIYYSLNVKNILTFICVSRITVAHNCQAKELTSRQKE